MAVVRDQKVRMAVIIEIADAGGLRPTGARQSGLLTHFGKVTLAIVAVELRAGGWSVGVERGSVRDEDVVGAVAVVVENRGSGAGAFQNVVFLVLAAESDWSCEPRLGCNVDEADGRRVGQQENGEKREHSDHKPERHLTGPGLAQHILQSHVHIFSSRAATPALAGTPGQPRPIAASSRKGRPVIHGLLQD